MYKHTHGKFSVLVALFGNLLVTILKSIVAFISGSSSMFAESVHSFADTLNQSLLMIGLVRSKKPADSYRGYGYGIERFFWSLVSACGILFIGAGITIYHSIVSIIELPETPYELTYFNFLILIFAFLVEGATLIIAVNEMRRGKKLTRRVFKEADPVTLAVVYEDGAAVLGVLVAVLAQALSYFTQNYIYDAVGGIIVGLILGSLAILLIRKNYNYIIGKSIDDERKEEIIDFIKEDPCIENLLDFKSSAVDFGKYRVFITVEWNGSPLYEDIYEAGDLKEEFDEIKDDFQEFAKLMFKMTDRIPRLVGNRIDALEKRVQDAYPEIAYLDIEIN